MSELPIIQTVSCAGCGVCCMHMRSPPFNVLLKDARTATFRDHDSIEDGPTDDLKWLMSAPLRARREMLSQMMADISVVPDASPCSWFDHEKKQCRYYGNRPQICREFEMGGEDCLRQRRQAGIKETST